MSKVGIVVPYRDRARQLRDFLQHLDNFIDVEYEIVIVEQADDKPFNRGKLINIGYLKAKELGCTYIIAHDIDLLSDEKYFHFRPHFTHLVDGIKSRRGFTRDNFDEYAGGVTLIPNTVFEDVNGYPNDYWGWGFEDDAFFDRIQRTGHDIDFKTVKQLPQQRDGIRVRPGSYVKLGNPLNTKRNFTITVEFTIESMVSDPNAITDIQSIFSIPGYDTTLCYDSFQHFRFQFWKKSLKSISITTKDHYPDGSYRAVVEINNEEKYIRFSLNGSQVGKQSFDSISNIGKEPIYLGCGDPTRETDNNWSDCMIGAFKIEDQDRVLVDYTVEDSEFVNKGFKTGKAECVNTSIEEIYGSESKLVPIPIRDGVQFKATPHKENGYVDGYWKNWSSRENQIKYYNSKYSKRDSSYFNGLTTLKYDVVKYKYYKNLSYHKLAVTL